MKKDINPPVVEDVAVAVVQEENELAELVWNVYLINQRNETIENVLVSSKGYITDVAGKETKTSALRHAIGNVEAGEYALIEPIMENVFALHNEYWVSYFIDGQVYDKKFIFVPDSIVEENLIFIEETFHLKPIGIWIEKLSLNELYV